MSLQPTAAAAGGHYLEALRNSEDRTPVRVQPLSPYIRKWLTGISDGYSRVRLSELSRALYDNGGFVSYAVHQIANYSVPLYPQADSTDDDGGRAAEEYFADWASRADFLGRADCDFATLQTLACHAFDLDGDILAVMRADDGFPQLQLLDGWQIGTPMGRHSDHSILDGVQLDGNGRVTGYWHDKGKDGADFILAAQCYLLRDPSVVSPYRGISPMRRGLNDMRDARDILGFEKLATKHSSALLGFIQGGAIEEGHGFDLNLGDGTEEIPGDPDPDTETTGEKGFSRADMLGGDIPVLEDGRAFQPAKVNRPNAEFEPFQNVLLSGFAAGLDIPPAFFLDSKLTNPNQRSVNAKAQRKFNQRQLAFVRFGTWVWVRVIGHAIQVGDLKPFDNWWKVRWQRPARFTIDAGREAAQEREDQARGLMTRQESYGGRGKDWQAETDQVFREDAYIIERIKDQSDQFGIPLDALLARWGFTAKASQPANQQDNAGAQDGQQDQGGDGTQDGGDQQDNQRRRDRQQDDGEEDQ